VPLAFLLHARQRVTGDDAARAHPAHDQRQVPDPFGDDPPDTVLDHARVDLDVVVPLGEPDQYDVHPGGQQVVQEPVARG
jgi:hypothetical protein